MATFTLFKKHSCRHGDLESRRPLAAAAAAIMSVITVNRRARAVCAARFTARLTRTHTKDVHYIKSGRSQDLMSHTANLGVLAHYRKISFIS